MNYELRTLDCEVEHLKITIRKFWKISPGPGFLNSSRIISFRPWADEKLKVRWAQLTLVENDPGQYDLQFWLDYFKRVHADVACLSTGGCVAYYPTKIPFHYRSTWLLLP